MLLITLKKKSHQGDSWGEQGEMKKAPIGAFRGKYI